MICIGLINIQGLTKYKAIELERVIKEEHLSLLCLTETQQKYKRVDFADFVQELSVMREENDKRGGGLIALSRKGKFQSIGMKQVINNDLLEIEVTECGTKITILLLYMDVQDQGRNGLIRGELERKLLELCDENLLVMGDFNGHLGIIGKQRVDRHGKYILELMRRWNLTLLNADDRCDGEITREQRGERSAIDFVLVNDRLYSCFVRMSIDEKKSTFDLSDHCLIKLFLDLQVGRGDIKPLGVEDVEFYDVKREELQQKYMESLERDFSHLLEENICMETVEKIIKKKADKHLKRKIKRRVTTERTEPIWLNEEIKQSIKKRREYNRKRRNAAETSEREDYRFLYEVQKQVAKKKVHEALVEHERKVTDEIKNGRKSNKNLWKNINKLRGKDLTHEYVKIYDAQGEEMGAECVDEMNKFWRTIYRKHRNGIPQVWNDEAKIEYEREILEEENYNVNMYYDGIHITSFPNSLEEHYSAVRGNRIEISGDKMALEIPLEERCYINIPEELREHFDSLKGEIEEKHLSKMATVFFTNNEVRSHLKKLKCNKQSGPDGIKPEMLKWMADSDICVTILTKSINVIVRKGGPPENWKKSKTYPKSRNQEYKTSDQ